MIIWLASYPKSGNTWVRSFLSSLIYNKDGTADLNSMPISQYPVQGHFKGLVNEFDNINLLSEKWILSQDLLNLDNKIKFFKTHHVMCNFGKNSFTNYENTFGVIYIVRDPRNVITSILNYYSKGNYEEAKEFLFDERKIIGVDFSKNNENESENNIITLISSWKTHYNSWKNFKKNFLLIKYENLINNERNEFLKIRNYLEEKLNLNFSDNKFDKAISSNSFAKLKDIEKIEGFSENVKNNFKPQVNFFNLGPENDYKKLLDQKVSKEIERAFYSEMKELGYI
tara:strand:- start:36 stop:887 length:852 start_codon:yes stop_codon:yes gene_type:complete